MKKGFTLIEILVTVALVGIIAGIGVRAISAILGSYSKSSVVNSLQSEGARVMSEITRVVRSSTSASTVGSSQLNLVVDENSIEWDTARQCRLIVFLLQNDAATGNGFVQRQERDCAGATQDLDLTDHSDTGVNVTGLSFVVSGGSGVPHQVEIGLILSQSAALPGSDPNYTSQISLQRVVSTRAY